MFTEQDSMLETIRDLSNLGVNVYELREANNQQLADLLDGLNRLYRVIDK